MSSVTSKKKTPPAAETVLFYVLARSLRSKHHVPFLECVAKNVKEKHFVQPLLPETTLIVEKNPIPSSLTGVVGYRAAAAADEVGNFYGDMILDTSVLDELPDIFSQFGHHAFYCSEKAKAIIESEDPDAHQFIPISIIKKNNGERVDTQYYGVIPGRYLYLKRDGSHPEPRMDYIEHPPTTNLLERIQETVEAHDFIQSWPLWAHGISVTRPFFSPVLYHALLRAGVSGIEEFGEGQITPTNETVGHIFR